MEYGHIVIYIKVNLNQVTLLIFESKKRVFYYKIIDSVGYAYGTCLNIHQLSLSEAVKATVVTVTRLLILRTFFNLK